MADKQVNGITSNYIERYRHGSNDAFYHMAAYINFKNRPGMEEHR